MKAAQEKALTALREVIDAYAGRFKQLNGAADLAQYLSRPVDREDEEILTEPILGDLLERILDFPKGSYFPQFSRSGLKPDFTPLDLVAHRFVLDAKSSAQRDLDAHEPQIRSYIDQRHLDFGLLFNLRDIRVYRRGESGHVPELSFPIQPLWEVAGGAALPGEELERFDRFRATFAHRTMGLDDKIGHIRRAKPWKELDDGGALAIDIEYLVERLRSLSVQLSADAASQQGELDRFLNLNPGRGDALVAELRTLALELDPGADPSTLPADVAGYRSAADLAGRAWRQYLMRVSQLALIRILLYRSWEDAGFVDERLYDGGFGRLYEKLGHRVQDVLAVAFAAGRSRYHWLFGQDTTYDWFRPRDEALVDVLYALTPVPLGKLDADVLGGLYEAYVVDDVDRDRLGQFFTPRSVIRFMLDRAEFAGAEHVFRLEGDVRGPRRVLDFATGSGGFLVEAARRIIAASPSDDPAALDEALVAIVRGLHGAEISPFPYYLTEVNVLLQVSRVLGSLRQLRVEPPPFVLGVVHTDTLAVRRGSDRSISGLEAGARADHEPLQPDLRFGLVPLDAEKAAAFSRMQEPGSFDLVVGNPPYVAEANNKVLFDRLRCLPGWKDVYRGKTDYLYYFLQLAAERVAPGGRLAVITPAAWMNAGNADRLREQLAGLLRLDELFLFGGFRLFTPEHVTPGDFRRTPPPTLESAILIATRAEAPKDHELRIVALEDERAASRALHGPHGPASPEREALLALMATRIGGRAGRRDGLLVHRVRQSGLDHDAPWPVKVRAGDLGPRVVKHLDKQESAGLAEPISGHWVVMQGIQTGADAYTERIRKRLTTSEQQELAGSGLNIGDAVLELPEAKAGLAPWADVPELLARSPEATALLYGAIDTSTQTRLVWIDRSDTVPQTVVDALQPWKPLLSTRAAIARDTKRNWYETAWPRDKAIMRRPKVIALYRTDRGRFALDELGDWQPSIKATICVAKTPGASVAYLCGVLNSEMLDVWFGVRGKNPRDIWRNYEPKHMQRMPCRHVVPAPDDDARCAAIVSAESAGDVDALLVASADLLATAAQADVLARAVEALVRAVARNRERVLALRDVAPLLERVVKDPWFDEPVSIDARAALASMTPSARRSLRVEPSVTIESKAASEQRLGRPARVETGLEFRHGKRQTALVRADDVRLGLLEALVRRDPPVLVEHLRALELPADPAAFLDAVASREGEIAALLTQGRDLVEAVERIVCRLHGVPDDLADELVLHALEHARTRMADT